MTEKDVELAATEDDRNGSDRLEIEGKGWQLEGIGVVNEHGEGIHEAKNVGVSYGEIEDASHLDPPKQLPDDRPVRKISDSSLKAL